MDFKEMEDNTIHVCTGFWLSPLAQTRRTSGIVFLYGPTLNFGLNGKSVVQLSLYDKTIQKVPSIPFPVSRSSQYPVEPRAFISY